MGKAWQRGPYQREQLRDQSRDFSCVRRHAHTSPPPKQLFCTGFAQSTGLLFARAERVYRGGACAICVQWVVGRSPLARAGLRPVKVCPPASADGLCGAENAVLRSGSTTHDTCRAASMRATSTRSAPAPSAPPGLSEERAPHPREGRAAQRGSEPSATFMTKRPWRVALEGKISCAFRYRGYSLYFFSRPQVRVILEEWKYTWALTADGSRG